MRFAFFLHRLLLPVLRCMPPRADFPSERPSPAGAERGEKATESSFGASVRHLISALNMRRPPDPATAAQLKEFRDFLLVRAGLSMEGCKSHAMCYQGFNPHNKKWSSSSGRRLS
jgi:hypothetical protein